MKPQIDARLLLKSSSNEDVAAVLGDALKTTIAQSECNSSLQELQSANVAAAIIRGERIVSGLERVSRKYQIDLCDVLIFIACGIINLRTTNQDIVVMQLANRSSIAHYLRMSRETVRRRLLKLEDRKLISRVSCGYAVKDLKRWMQTMALMS